MFAFFVAQPNLPYAICFALVIGLGLIEVLAMLSGFSIMEALNDWVPYDANSKNSTGTVGFVGWLCLDKLPLFIWMVLAMASFSIAGYAINSASFIYSSMLVPEIFTMPLAIVMACFSCRYLGGLLAKSLPISDSDATSVDDFGGRLGTMTLGCAIKGSPCEALVKDQYEKKHYVLVEPDIEGVEFKAGSQVVLLKRDGQVWTATQFDS